MASDDLDLQTGNAGDGPVSGVASDPPVKRTRLVLVAAALLVLFVAGVAGGMLLQPLFRPQAAPDRRDTSQDKARIEVAIGLMKALRVNDLGAVKPFLTDAAQSAITAEQWSQVASASEIATATFAATKWSGDTTATIGYEVEGGTGTMAFAPSPDEPDVIVMTETGPDGELVYNIGLVPVGSGWRAVSLTPKAETYPLDADFVRSLISTDESL